MANKRPPLMSDTPCPESAADRANALRIVMAQDVPNVTTAQDVPNVTIAQDVRERLTYLNAALALVFAPHANPHDTPPDSPPTTDTLPSNAPHLLIACLVPNTTRAHWNAALCNDSSFAAMASTLAVFELDERTTPHLHTHIKQALSNADVTLASRQHEHTRRQRATQVQAAEKHFLFFGATGDV